MAIGSVYNAVSFSEYNRGLTLRKEEKQGDIRIKTCRIHHRLYVFPSVKHDGSKYLFTSTPKIYVTCGNRINGKNAYNYTWDYPIPPTFFSLQLRDGVKISGLREDLVYSQYWFPNDSDGSRIYDVLLNDTNRGGPMYPSEQSHSMVVYLRFRRRSIMTNNQLGVMLEAVHAYGGVTPPPESNGNFLLFFP